MELEEEQRAIEGLQNTIGHEPEGWIPTQHQEEAMELCKQMKALPLALTKLAEEWTELEGHWYWGRGQIEIYVMNRARYSIVLYLICCCIRSDTEIQLAANLL